MLLTLLPHHDILCYAASRYSRMKDTSVACLLPLQDFPEVNRSLMLLKQSSLTLQDSSCCCAIVQTEGTFSCIASESSGTSCYPLVFVFATQNLRTTTMHDRKLSFSGSEQQEVFCPGWDCEVSSVKIDSNPLAVGVDVSVSNSNLSNSSEISTRL